MADEGRVRHFFEDIADHAGAAYLRYSFTRGTEQEVEFLVDALELAQGDRVLDVGCGPGRHAHALADRGVEVVGIDVSERFVRLAAGRGTRGARFGRGDARCLPARDGAFDAVVSLCQGGFGLVSDDDPRVLDEIVRTLRPGGRAAVTAFSAYFQVRWLEEGDEFDPDRGVNHEVAEVRSEAGVPAAFDLWTSCFTPRELRLLAARSGASVDAVWSVSPGDYARRPPDLQHPEWLMILRRP